MRRGMLLPCIAFAISVAAVLVTASGIDAPAVRIPVGLLTVLVAPGFVLQQALFPGDQVDRVERCALTLGLSVVLGVLGALLLHITGVGLTARTWALLLCGVTGIATAAVVARAYPERPMHKPAQPLSPRRIRSAAPMVVLSLVTALASVALTTTAVVIARDGAGRAAGASKFTQLWLVPRMDEPSRVDVGVFNHEGGAVSYHVDLVSGSRTVDRYELVLNAGETWRQETDLARFVGHEVRAVLFRTDRGDRPYREVRLRQVRR